MCTYKQYLHMGKEDVTVGGMCICVQLTTGGMCICVQLTLKCMCICVQLRV